MPDIDLLSAFTSHFEPRVQQSLICGNFQHTSEYTRHISIPCLEKRGTALGHPYEISAGNM
jgi:hypothetical protein